MNFPVIGNANDGTIGALLLAGDAAAGERTGFPNLTDSEIVWTDATPDRTLTLQPKAPATSFAVYFDSIPTNYASAQTVQITDTEGQWWFYIDKADKTLKATQTFSADLILVHSIVSEGYWDATNKKMLFGDVSEERHGIRMDGATHYREHTALGATTVSGMLIENLTVNGDGSANSHAQLSVSIGEFLDEDIRIILAATANPAVLRVLYLDGATPVWRETTANAYPVIPFSGGSNRLAYNQLTGGSYQQTEVGNGDYVLCHIFGNNRYGTPEYFAIQGQDSYGNANQAEEGALVELTNLFTTGLPIAEFRPIATIIYQTGAYANAVKARVRPAADGDYVDWRRTGTSGIGATSVTPDNRFIRVTEVDAATYEVDETLDEYLDVQYTSTGACSITFPDEFFVVGRTVVVKDGARNAATFNISLLTESAQTIEGAASATINVNGQSITVAVDSTGTNLAVY